MEDFEKPIIIGVVFDLSLDHGKDGSRYIDGIKSGLVKHLVDTGMST